MPFRSLAACATLAVALGTLVTAPRAASGSVPCDAALRDATVAMEASYARGGFVPAREALVALAGACEDGRALRDARLALAGAALDLGDADEGQRWLEAAAAAVRSDDDRLRVAGVAARVRAARGDLAGALAERDALARELASAAESTAAVENAVYRAGLLNNLGRPDALAACEAALRTVLEARPPADRLALDARANYVRALAPAGRLDEARAEALRNLAIVRDAYGEQGLRAADQLDLLALVPLFAGDAVAARPAAERTVVLTARELGDAAPATIRALELLNFVEARLGRIDEAVATQRRIVAALQSTLGPGHPRVHVAQANLAAWLLAEGRSGEALPILVAAHAAIAAGEGARSRAAFDVGLDVARALQDAGRTGEGCERVAALVDGADPAWGAQALPLRARCLVAAERWADARELLRGAVVAPGADGVALDLLAALAHIELEQGDADAARGTLERLRQLAEAERRRDAPAPGSGRALFARRVAGREQAAGLRDLAWLSARAGDVRTAIAVSEEVRSRSLLDALAVRGTAGRPTGEQLRLRAADLRLRDLEAQLALSPPGTAERARLSVARDALAAERDRLAAAAPAVANEAFDLEAFVRGLGDDEAVVGLQAARGRAWTWVLRRQRAPAVRTLRSADGLLRDLGVLREAAMQRSAAPPLWRLPDGSHALALLPPHPAAVRVDLPALARSVYEALLGPHAADLRGVRRLTVVADGPFGGFPVEVLHDADGPLARRLVVRYAPSLATRALASRRATRAGPALDLVAIGPPGYETLGAAGPGPHAGRRFAPLPGARREVAQVAAQVASGRRIVLAGREASAQRWAQLAADGTLARARWVHVAAHAVLVPEAPQWSALVLGGPDERGPGYVTAAQLAATELHADLVVLSACETALGREVAGEGLFGLPYALAVAGARATVLSLWPVDDEATAELMRRFYAGLVRGTAPAVALAQAKRELARHPRWAAPFYWAPFVLVGAGGG
ncbi:MAG TPA: CHAT domain-containing tetratricopeptide repeat protein [Casimicrobiaceae bacterium]|nr:CHAT domain-containing tetratricopeptide repeat protein [Casimicrobiaceae bacterium]